MQSNLPSDETIEKILKINRIYTQIVEDLNNKGKPFKISLFDFIREHWND